MFKENLLEIAGTFIERTGGFNGYDAIIGVGIIIVYCFFGSAIFGVLEIFGLLLMYDYSISSSSSSP